MMVEVLRDRCIASGNCADLSPEVFGQDDEGFVVLLRDDVDDPLAPSVTEAADTCPVAAIMIAGAAFE